MRASTLLRTLSIFTAILVGGTATGGMSDTANAQTPRPKAAAPKAAERAPKQEAPVQVAAVQPTAEQAAGPAWVSRCASATRQSVPECVVEQTAFLTKTGQLIASITVRLPPTNNQPVMMIQVPIGLYLPAGIAIQVDEAAPVRLAVQTCDLKGCYAGEQMSAELLSAMKAGKKLAIVFQNLNKQNITVPLTLALFAETYQRIQ